MARYSGVILLSLLSALAPARAGGQGASDVRTVRLTGTVEIPITILKPQDATGAPAGANSPLAVWPGAADEPPEGPDGFNVLGEGDLLITDPLRDRVSVFDPQGKFRQSWLVGFAADSIERGQDRLALLRDASTGQFHAFDREGQPLSMEEGAPAAAAARLLNGKSGTVARPGVSDSPIEIFWDKPGSILLSLESLGTDQDGNTYVALETTRSGDDTEGINLSKFVRKYSRQGHLVSETTAIPLDYYVIPVDELRVYRGVVYQLMTTRTEVRVNMWNMN